ncbi:hypothetical protein LWI28_000781 [Acer negundo]|uniref:Uncharacterized protein n=1 Tax=Acer negundo TaxID=4023 RepID=A0AAD5J365_ACENE|nr:hypothetical protein LWI28_000781 [Acer negundo]
MPVFNATNIVKSPLLIPPVKAGNHYREQVNDFGHGTASVSMQFQSSRGSNNRQIKLSASGPVGLGCKLQPNRRRMQSAFIACASASGQTQTLTREAPTTTITNAPASPKLDDGGSGFPPRDDGGGGGGGGGGDNCSGGFYLFGFLYFLSILKDLESVENDRGRRRR